MAADAPRRPASRPVVEGVSWLLAGGVVAVVLLAQAAGLLRLFENVLHDQAFRLRGDDERRSPFVRLLEINDECLVGALRGVGADMEFGTWPWSRDKWALLEEYVFSEPDWRPAVVVYDIFFDLPNTKDVTGDALFARALAASRRSMLACEFLSLVPQSARVADAPPAREPASMASFRRFALARVDETRGDPYVADELVLPASYSSTLAGADGENEAIDFVSPAIGIGFTNAPPDSDGVTRRFPLVVKFNGAHYPALPLLAAAALLGAGPEEIEVVYGSHVAIYAPNGEVRRVPVDKHGALRLDIRSKGWLPEFATLNYVEVIAALKAVHDGAQPDDDLERLRDCAVVIGVTAGISSDIHTVPVSEAYPGAAIIAGVIENILEQRAVRAAPPWAVVALTLLFALIGMGAARAERLGPLLLLLGALVIVGAFLYGALALFTRALVLAPVMAPLLSGVGCFTVEVWHRRKLAELQKARIKSVFGRLVSEDVMNELLEHPEDVALGGQSRVVAILFTDIKGYTALAETMAAGDVVELLNEYFTEMVELVLANEGTLDKYVGDAMMVVFGAPKHYERAETFVYLAVRCALMMQRRMNDLRARARAAGKPEIHMRVGINCGEVVVGLIGSVKRHEYTVIGDAVNLASRLESNAPVDGVLISESVYALVADRVIAEKMPPIEVKNKREPVHTYVVMGLREEPAS